jgi:2'-5' RNA ligase
MINNNKGLCAKKTKLGKKPVSTSPNLIPPSEFSLATPVVTTAIIIQPPKELWTHIQAIRKTHDKAFARWMPHINMIYPFLPAERFRPSMIELIQSTLKDVKPFKISLTEFSNFDHGKNATFFLNPDNALLQLKLIHNKLVSIFPQCNALSVKGANGFAPHLTCGQCLVSNYNKLKVELAKTFVPIEWDVTEIYLISRVGDTPFEVKFTIPLNNGAYYDPNELSIPIVSVPEYVCPIDESQNMGIAMNRVKKWISHTGDREKLPKSRAAMCNSIKAMCIVPVAITNVDYVYEVLKAEGFFIEVANEINYLKTPDSLRDHIATQVDSKELRVCLQEVREWVVQKKNNPKTKEALSKCLSYLVMKKVVIEPSDVIDELIKLQYLRIEDEYDQQKRTSVEKVIYCI